MKIEVVLTEAEIAQEFIESMQARDLPEKFFYWLPRSVRAWCALAQESGYYVDMNRSWKQAMADVGEVVRPFGKTVPVISLGAGDGLKDRALMRVICEEGRQARYFPVEASQALLEMAYAGAEDDDIETVGIKADISSPPHLVFAADAAASPRLFIMSGGTLGGFDPLMEIRAIAQAMARGDRLLVDGEIRREDSAARRDNPAVRKWVFAPLAGAGITPADGEVRFEEKRDERRSGLYPITRVFRTTQDVHAAAAGEDVVIQKGERISLNFRYVYSEETFRWLIEKHAGLKIVREYPSPEKRFLTVLCER
jgi:uncharacterized SAM-dependent methyltransferase